MCNFHGTSVLGYWLSALLYAMEDIAICVHSSMHMDPYPCISCELVELHCEISYAFSQDCLTILCGWMN